jgi:chromosome partitioning protein
MTTINQLPLLTTLSGGDNLVVWSPSNGDSRRVPYSFIKADIQAGLISTEAGVINVQAAPYNTPANGIGDATAGLAAAFAAVGKRVLLVDLDSQNNASTGVGYAAPPGHPHLYHALLGLHTAAALRWETAVPGLHLLPAGQDLAAIEVELANAPRREARLRELLHTLAHAYDVVLIDCPPALGLMTINAMVAADGLLIPLQAEFLALTGLARLLHSADRIAKRYNTGLVIEGVVLTMYDRRSALAHSVEQDVRTHLGALVYHTTIPRNVRAAEAPSHGKPLLLYDTRCAAALAYMQLASEMLRSAAWGKFTKE